MVKYFDEPVKMSALDFSEDSGNEGKTALFNLRENLMYAEGGSEDWVELEEKREAMEEPEDFYVATGPIKKMVMNSLGWR